MVMFLWHTTVAVQSRWVLKNTEQVSMPEFKSSTVLSPAVADPQEGGSVPAWVHMELPEQAGRD